MWQKRDIIVLSKCSEEDAIGLEQEVQSISMALYQVESLEAYCKANEVIDINRYKIINTPYLVHKTISDRIRPFVFLFNKN